MTAQSIKSVHLYEVPSEPVEAYLSTLNLFEDIKHIPEALAHVAGMMRQQTFSVGTEIFKAGDRDDRMFCLMNGEAEVTKVTLDGDRFQVAVLNSSNGAIFGEGALLDADSRSATIKAVTECVCIILDRANFQKFCQERPEWALPVLNRIAWSVMDRLRRLNGDFALLYHALVKNIRGE